jgi:23S rRNA (guanosine2251-2'-O)-methyltransferase
MSAERRRRGLDPERIVYGRHPLRELIRAGRREVFLVYATSNALEELRDEIPQGVQIKTMDHDGLSNLADSGDHQGIVAEVSPYDYVDPDKVLGGDNAFAFCLDQITDPRNLGAIARICDAVGASGIVIPRHRSAAVTAVVSKTSAGAIEHIPVAVCTNLANELERSKGDQTWIYGASEHGKQLHSQADYSTGGVIFVLGAEGAGLRPRVASSCDALVRIPMMGNVASLNVATAAAVLGYEALRQRGAAS